MTRLLTRAVTVMCVAVTVTTLVSAQPRFRAAHSEPNTHLPGLCNSLLATYVL